MNIRTIAGATALTIALSTGAFAATMHHKAAPTMKPPVAWACVSLENQFKSALPHHKKARWLKTAKAFAAQGAKFCAEGRPIRGEFDLRRALRDIGVVPKA